MDKLIRVTLYPCSGITGFRPSNHRYACDEWYYDVNGKLYKCRCRTYFDTPDEAQRHYEPILRYATGTFVREDASTGRIEEANFIVTGSHSFCLECKAYSREQRILCYMDERGVSREEAERKEEEVEEEFRQWKLRRQK